ncbi:MAG: hypothetical protein HOB14_00315 [Gammaproteobacteria bacterium]|jgi:hypothetical protein|nr:hypothetical protein [Gammaproteobacteria bacterium]MBT3723848.1 hypothetical protein [Gammaproteobacteria bacterium]MBT4193761.1 hypothetical protein [Gammaproteobacteria bacterium]MBT4452362.1 hypothetical protein [Gammaproteobacteria bacterium]MBT4861973.1 hypothetical protein [Gammaproteobacteria bacterium]
MSLKETIKSARDKLKTEDWVVFHKNLLEQKYQNYQNGEKFALLEAVEICSLGDIKIPEWAANGYVDAIHKLKQFQVESLDDAFGYQRPKNRHLHNHQRNKRIKLPVFMACIKAKLEHDAPLTRKTRSKNAFEYAGEQFNISAGLANKLYSEINQLLPELKDQLLNTTK